MLQIVVKRVQRSEATEGVQTYWSELGACCCQRCSEQLHSAGRKCPRVLYPRPRCDHTAGEHMTLLRRSQFSARRPNQEGLIKSAEQGLIKPALIRQE